ncbi:MAG: FtsX-like permease family protein, partial [Glutamicibacter arilaitensis]|uniref:FtsX-like permease family protein n=1 Tax=Glutamicibacter arilaitensis TaxID=256701 RepID=UPI003FD21CB3
LFRSMFLLAGASLLGYGAFKVDLIIAFLGGLVSFPGILMLASLFVPSSVSGIGKAVAGKSTAGKLAALNAVRNPGRTTATATALLIGVTLVSMIMVGGQTAKASLNNAVAAEFPVDMMVSFYDRKVSDSEIKSMLEKIGEVEGITAGSSFTSAYADVDMGTGEMYNSEIMSVDPEGFAEVALDPDIVPADGEIVYVLSNPENPTVKIGDQTLKVKKTEAMLSGNIVTEQTFDKLEVEEANQYTGILLKVDSDVRASAVNDLVTKISAITGVESSMINGGLVMKSMFSQIIDVLLMIVSALLAVAVLIALIGVANTLSLSILERTRENSLLRALGLKKKQLRGMLATEAVLIGGVAALLGLVLGVVYGLLGARSALASMGEMTYEIPWLQLALVLLISIVAALLASVTPGRRAAKLSPVEGLAVE